MIAWVYSRLGAWHKEVQTISREQEQKFNTSLRAFMPHVLTFTRSRLLEFTTYSVCDRRSRSGRWHVHKTNVHQLPTVISDAARQLNNLKGVNHQCITSSAQL
ncbi:hypothetical protein K439DRAFT_82073 [Ramaria rubella]|nr:hypothetical protein K439DRAFT_82073 [Ramaria rubella]